MSETRSYPLPKSLWQFDASRPTRLSDVQRILDADKELRRFTGFSPLTADFRQFIRSLRLRILAAPHLLEELDYKKPGTELIKVIKKPSPIDGDDLNETIVPEPEVIESISDTNITDPALIQPRDGNFEEMIAPEDGTEFGNTDGIHIPYHKCGSSQIGVMIRKKEFPFKPKKSLSEKSESKKKSKKGSKKPRKKKSSDSSELGVAVCKKDYSNEKETPSIIKQRKQTLDLLAKKGVHVVSSDDPKPERITKTCRKHHCTYTYKILRKKYAVEVYDVDQIADV